MDVREEPGERHEGERGGDGLGTRVAANNGVALFDHLSFGGRPGARLAGQPLERREAMQHEQHEHERRANPHEHTAEEHVRVDAPALQRTGQHSTVHTIAITNSCSRADGRAG